MVMQARVRESITHCEQRKKKRKVQKETKRILKEKRIGKQLRWER